eukprot:UN01982
MSTQDNDIRRAIYTHPKHKDLVIDSQLHIYNEIPDENAQKQIEELKLWLDKTPTTGPDGNDGTVENNEEYPPRVYRENKAYLDNRIFNDKQLMRFLRARQFNMTNTKAMIADYAQWCVENHPESITFDSVAKEAETGKVSIRGKDKFGRPVIVFHNEFENSTDYDNMNRHLLFNLEYAVSQLEGDVSHYVFILNMSNFSYFKCPPIDNSKKAAAAFANIYPELMGFVAVINAPWSFRAFYTAMTVILDQRTKSKIHFIKEDEYADKLSFFLGDNWPQLTGLNQPQIADHIAPGFDPEKWAAECRAYDQKRMNNMNNAHKTTATATNNTLEQTPEQSTQ